MKKMISMLLVFAMVIGMLPMVTVADTVENASDNVSDENVEPTVITETAPSEPEKIQPTSPVLVADTEDHIDTFAMEKENGVLSGDCGESLTWSFDQGTGTLRISGHGSMENYERESAPWYPYWEQIETLIIDEGVTSIGTCAFADCHNIFTAIIPKSIVSVGMEAFRYCINLSDVYITDLTAWCNIVFADTSPGSNIYLNGKLLSEIDIPKDTAKISSYAFYNKNGIKKITIPSNVNCLEDFAYGLNGPDNTVVFLGDAPEFSDLAFGNLIATVYYPQNHDGWIENVRQCYGGEITWVGYERNDEILIAVQPESVSVKEENHATFSVMAIGEGLSYQWCFKAGNDDSWVNIASTEGHLAELTVTANAGTEGSYRCVITDRFGNQVTSQIAELELITYSNCISYTPQMTEDVFRYLDEIYINKYPEMGLRFVYGSESDKRVLEDLAEVISQGCVTDRQIVNAIESWMIRNIDYFEGAPSYPIDVLHSKTANCFGYALMMQTLARLCGIPAVWGDGWRGDMTNLEPTDIFNLAGHAWCFVYLDGEWVLFDPLYYNGGTTDRDYISQWYYNKYVEAVVPVYDVSQFPHLPESLIYNCYVDGNYYTYEDGQIHEGGVTTSINVDTRFSVSSYSEDSSWSYTEKTADMVTGEVYRDGWLDYAGNWYHYAYENGIQAYASVIDWNGQDYYMGDVSAMKICLPESEYWVESACFTVDSSYSGKILEPAWTEDYIVNMGGKIRWSSSDTNIATVDSAGTVTCKAPGRVTISTDLVYLLNGEEISWAHVSYDVCFSSEKRKYDLRDTVADHDHAYTAIDRDYYILYTCREAGCADSYTEVNSNHKHHYDTIVTAPTCTSTGFTTYACPCGDRYIADHVPVREHTWNDLNTCKFCSISRCEIEGHVEEVVEAIPPTCTSSGWTEGKSCSVCGEVIVEQNVINALGHTEIIDPAVAATCITTGKTEGRHCSVCNMVLIPQNEIPTVGHTFDYWVEGEGQSRRECVYCAFTETLFDFTGSTTVSIEDFEESDAEFKMDDVMDTEDSRFILVEEALKKDEEKDHEILHVFDITMEENGQQTQPDGTVKVKLLDEWEDDIVYKVYYVSDDGSCVDMNAYRQDEYLIFDTDHFSLYALVKETAKEDPPTQEHQHSYTTVVTKPTCTEKGYTIYTCSCGDSYTDNEVAALGHKWDNGVITREPTAVAPGIRTYTCTVCEATKTEEIPYEVPVVDGSVQRISGKDRVKTALSVAKALKDTLGVDKFDAVIIATGVNEKFADALAGSYLANRKKAPILLYTNSGLSQLNVNFIRENLKANGTVYILGGDSAVPVSVEQTLSAYNVVRLSGKTRYETNLAILKEAGISGNEILVATGTNFADSLSASAVGLPLLLVNGKNTAPNAVQTEFLKSVAGKKTTIIGGDGAVSEEMKAAIEKITGVTAERISGKTRHNTSVMIARKYFADADFALITYAKNFPDGLAGGPLAYAMGAPLLLTSAGQEGIAGDYITAGSIENGYVLGGDSAVSDETARKVFGLAADAAIEKAYYTE